LDCQPRLHRFLFCTLPRPLHTLRMAGLAASAGEPCLLVLAACSRGEALPSRSIRSRRGNAPGAFSGRCSSAAVRFSLNRAGPAEPGLIYHVSLLRWSPYTWLCPKMTMSGLCSMTRAFAAGVSADVHHRLLLSLTQQSVQDRMHTGAFSWHDAEAPPLGGLPQMCVMRMRQPFTLSTCASGSSSRLAQSSTLPLMMRNTVDGSQRCGLHALICLAG
jgi:hypothetical protein